MPMLWWRSLARIVLNEGMLRHFMGFRFDFMRCRCLLPQAAPSHDACDAWAGSTRVHQRCGLGGGCAATGDSGASAAGCSRSDEATGWETNLSISDLWLITFLQPSLCMQPKACDTSCCDFENIFSQSQIVEIPTFQEITVEQEIPEVGLQVEKTYQSKDSLGKNIHKPRLWVFARWQRSEFCILTYLTGRAWCVSWGASRQQGGWGMGVWRHCM